MSRIVRLTAVMMAALVLSVSNTAQARNLLVQDGRAMAEVVLPASANPIERYAAQELVWHIEKATGVKLPVVQEGQPVTEGRLRVWIGATHALRDAGIDLQAMPPAGHVIKTTSQGLFLAGHDSAGELRSPFTATGTLHAVADFLERELEVRWLWPGRDGTVVRPRKQLDASDYDLRVEPVFDTSRLRSAPWQWARLAARTTFAPSNTIGNHAFTNWYKTYGKTNPEWFAQQDEKGTRRTDVTTSMCVSNPGFHREIVRLWNLKRQENPGKPLALNLSENDTAGVCICETCLSWDGPDKRFSFFDQTSRGSKNVGERYARFYHEVWKLASQIDPDVRIVAYAYSNYIYAPSSTRLNGQFVMALVPPSLYPYTPSMKKQIDDNHAAWGEAGVSFVYRPNIFSGYVMPQNYVTQYHDEFRSVWDTGKLIGVDVDGPNISFAMQGPMIYVMARSLVTPDRPLEDMLQEYYQGFGQAAEAVRQYWEFWEKYTMDHAELFNEIPKKKNKINFSRFFGFHDAFYAHDLFPVAVLESQRPVLERAATLVARNPDDLTRVRFLQAGLEHAILVSRTCELFDRPTASAAERLSAMNAVEHFRKTSLPEHAADLRLATGNGRNENVAWTFSDFDPNWMVELPLAWKLRTDPEHVGERAGYHQPGHDDRDWQTVTTDRHLERQGISDYRYAWYRQQFEIPAQFKGKRTVLRLGAVDENARVWVNGNLVGVFRYDPAIDPDSWEKPLEFDITAHLKDQGVNHVAVLVENNAGAGGLWKPSWLKFFEQDVAYVIDSELFKTHLPKANGFGRFTFLQELPNGTSVARFVSHPSVQAHVPWRDFAVNFNLPFKFVANRTFRVQTEFKLAGRTEGTFSVILQQRGVGGQSLKYDYLSLSRDTAGWVTQERSVAILPDTRSLRILLHGKQLNDGFEAQVRSVKIEPQ